MKGAFQIARIFGIPVRVHWTFALILLWIGYLVFDRTGGLNWWVMLGQTVFVLTLFFCVVLHEFGHALTARLYGVKTLDIILSPIGGVARLDRMPEKPIQEFWVAIAGPLVNVAIIIILLAGYYFLVPSDKFALFLEYPLFILNPDSNFIFADFDQQDIFIISLMVVNGILALFNLLPAFPLDGGRIFRALLSIRFGRLKATRIAAYLGQALAVGLIIYGLWQMDFILAIIGIFVFTMAENEFKSVKWETLLQEHTVADLYERHFHFFHHQDPIEQAFQQIQAGLAKYFLVFQTGSDQLMGYTTEGQIMKKSNSLDVPIQTITHSFPSQLSPEESLKSAFFKMQASNTPLLPVYEFETLTGVLDYEMIDRFIGNHG